MNCPNCGAEVEGDLRHIKLTICAFCSTTLILEDKAFRVAGQAGVMHDVPLLFDIGDTVSDAGEKVRIEGHARFSYGRGFWDEFWGRNAQGVSTWVSVDEGDVLFQAPAPRRDWPSLGGTMRIGRELNFNSTLFTVLEVDKAECVALRGSFDELLKVGERYTFLNAQSEDGDLLSGEIWGEEQAWFLGRWADPFDIVVERNDGA